MKHTPDPHQVAAFEFAIKNPYSILALEMGLGKSKVLLDIQEALKARGRGRLLVVCPAYLIPTWESEILKHCEDTIRYRLFDKGKKINKKIKNIDIVVTSYSLVQKAEFLFRWAQVVGIDECFHGSTKISTPTGDTPIENLREGDTVLNFGGVGAIEKIIRTPVERPIVLSIGGRKITCSDSHPFFTSEGWKDSGDLKIGDYICVDYEGLQGLREKFHKKMLPERSTLIHPVFKVLFDEEKRSEGLPLLQKKLHRKPLAEPTKPKKILLKRMRFGSYVYNLQRSSPRSSVSRGQSPSQIRLQKTKNPSSGTRGKWEVLPRRRPHSGGHVPFRVSAPIHRVRPLKVPKRVPMPVSLQARLRKSPSKDMRGNRRGLPQHHKGPREGFKKRHNIKFARVEGFEVSKSGSVRGKEESYFYDLQVSGHPSYFAEGALVHNCHSLKSIETKRTAFTHRSVFENSVPRMYLLTGTPIKNRVMEYYSLLALCNYNPRKKSSKFLNKFQNAIDFADHFSHRKEFTLRIRGKQITQVKWEGLKNKEELKQWLKPVYLRIKSEDVLKLERPVEKEILISNTNDHSLLKEFNLFFSNEDNQKTNISMKTEAAIKKVPFTTRYVKDLVEGGEVDCMPIYTDSVQACETLAKNLGVPPITGLVPVKQRQKIAERFRSGETKYLCATIGSFSQGVDLTVANNLTFNDLPWVPGDYDQAVFRIQRRNQTRRCTIHKIFGSPQDRYIARKLDDKRKVIEEVT